MTNIPRFTQYRFRAVDSLDDFNEPDQLHVEQYGVDSFQPLDAPAILPAGSHCRGIHVTFINHVERDDAPTILVDTSEPQPHGYVNQD